MIGGATTSKTHTAVKVQPHYSQTTVHVLDASRAVTVVSSLLSDETKQTFADNVNAEYDKIRADHAGKRSHKEYLTIGEARNHRLKTDWDKQELTKPTFLGVKVFDDYSIEELAKYIDWTPFFMAWELRGKYPAIFEDEYVGVEAKKLFDDAQGLLKKVIDEKWLTAKGVIGFFPANALEDDIEVYKDENRNEVLMQFHNLRQQIKKAPGQPNNSLADFIAPKKTGKQDYIGGFAVTTGIGIEKWVAKFEQEYDDYNAIMLKAIADRLAEAFAERLHERVRKEFWGYSKDESLTNEDLISEKYKGIRPAFGYPACPDHTEKFTLFELLDVEKNTGITLTESCAMYPTAAVSGVYFSHPQSKYFAVGKIDKDQIQEYAKRKGQPLEETEKWLGPYLNYEG